MTALVFPFIAVSVGAALYSVGADDLDREGRNALKHMAEITGGRFYSFRDRGADPLRMP